MGGITVSIVAGEDEASSRVSASGSIQHLITDAERGTFHVKDGDLKKAVASYFGKRPDDAYLHSPTPWSDLYKTYHWPQVSTVLSVRSAEILELTSNPVVVKTQTFTNDSRNRATFNVAIHDSVTDSITSGWSTGGTLSVSEEIEVSAELLGAGGKSTTNIGYSQSWGKSGGTSKDVTVGSESGVSVPLNPGESLDAELTASRGSLKVRITYVASLTGSTAINYSDPYKGHHFWGLPISRVMAGSGLSNKIVSTQDIEVGYYSNSVVRLKDKNGQVKAVRALADLAGAPA